MHIRFSKTVCVHICIGEMQCSLDGTILRYVAILYLLHRERERKMCVYIYMYIHIHIHAAHACKVAQTCTDPGADVLRTYLYQDTVYSITGRIMQQK